MNSHVSYAIAQQRAADFARSAQEARRDRVTHTTEKRAPSGAFLGRAVMRLRRGVANSQAPAIAESRPSGATQM